MYFLQFCLVGLVYFFINCHCMRMLKAIPGTPTLLFYDKQYIQNVIFNTRRYSRKSDYVVNLEFTILVPLGRNVSLSGIFYEYLHNEYRRSFVELHGNMCDFILKDPLVGAVVRKAGISTCPMPAGRYQLLNMSFEQEFPNLFPFEKGKGELIVKLPKEQIIARGDLVLTFKQRVV